MPSINPIAMTYMVWWPEQGVVKYGRAWKMSRLRRFVEMGARIVWLRHGTLAIEERSVLAIARAELAPAFASEDEARALLPGGRGWTEAFLVPTVALMNRAIDIFVEGIAPHVHQSAEAVAARGLEGSAPGGPAHRGAAPRNGSADDGGPGRPGDFEPVPDPLACVAGSGGAERVVADDGRDRGLHAAARRCGMADDLPEPESGNRRGLVPDPRQVAACLTRGGIETPSSPSLESFRKISGQWGERARAGAGECGRGCEGACERERAALRSTPPGNFTFSGPFRVAASTVVVLFGARRWTSGASGLQGLRHRTAQASALRRTESDPQAGCGRARGAGVDDARRDRHGDARPRGCRGRSPAPHRPNVRRRPDGVHRRRGPHRAHLTHTLPGAPL